MPIIHIYGASGSGTSTLGLAMQEKVGFFHLDTDDVYWLKTNPPFTKKREVYQRLEIMKQAIQEHANIVITGSLCGWGDELIDYFNLVIRLHTPTSLRLYRLQQREFLRFGARIQHGGDMEEEHQNFMQWASEYDEGSEEMRSKKMHDRWQAMLPCTHLDLDGTLPIDELIHRVQQVLSI